MVYNYSHGLVIPTLDLQEYIKIHHILYAIHYVPYYIPYNYIPYNTVPTLDLQVDAPDFGKLPNPQKPGSLGRRCRPALCQGGLLCTERSGPPFLNRCRHRFRYVCVYIYIYFCMIICLFLYINLFTYIERERRETNRIRIPKLPTLNPSPESGTPESPEHSNSQALATVLRKGCLAPVLTNGRT